MTSLAWAGSHVGLWAVDMVRNDERDLWIEEGQQLKLTEFGTVQFRTIFTARDDAFEHQNLISIRTSLKLLKIYLLRVYMYG